MFPPLYYQIFYRPVLYAQTMCLHIFMRALLCAVPPLTVGALQKYGGGCLSVCPIGRAY